MAPLGIVRERSPVCYRKRQRSETSKLRPEGNPMHVLITGAAGMIGRKLTERLPPDASPPPPPPPSAPAKAIAELLLADYAGRGFCGGGGLRLPAICVRPGKPNRAASGVFSSITREPLAGQEALLTIPDDVLHTHASPRAAVQHVLGEIGRAHV